MMSYEYRAQMMNGTIKDAKDNYENAQGNAEKEKYETEIQRLQSLQNAYKTAGEYEAKAKAWDTMKKDFEDIADTPMGQHILFNMSLIMEDVESGESDE